MRRLRGEQFCSLEHMDQYAAQQAEFALERLAASVTDRPSTERPPAIARPVPKLRPKTANADPVIATSELPTESVIQTAVALEEQDAASAVELIPTAAETEIPMAAYLAQNPIEPRTSESRGQKSPGFDPLDHWGKISPSWSMPAFHSEPGDPRTWNAGKLASQIPPIAGWRELLAPKAAEPVGSHRDVDPQLPYLAVAVEQITAIPARTELLSVFPQRLTEFKLRQLQQGTVASVLETESHTHSSWTGPVIATIAESDPSSFRVAENRLDAGLHMVTALRPQTLVFEWQDVGGAQIAPVAPIPGGFALAETGIQGLSPADTQRSSWDKRVAIATGAEESGTTMGPATTEAHIALPHPTPWNWTQTLQVPAVALPELHPAAMSYTHGVGSEWQEPKGTLQNPAIHQWIAPHLGYNGPSFGWESSPVRTTEANTGSVAEPPHFPEVDVRIRDYRAHVNAGLEAPGRIVLLGWSTPKLDTTELEVGPLVNLRPTVTTMAIQVRPLLPFRAAHLESVTNAFSSLTPVPGSAPAMVLKRAMRSVPAPVQVERLAIPGPAPMFPRSATTSRTPITSTAKSTTIAQAGPLKYSPVAIVVMPPPQFALLPAVLSDEQRCAAQTPNGVWRLPRVRHTGYRALGPFPKLPLRLPDRYLKTRASEVPPAFEEIPRQRVTVQQDPSLLPTFAAPVATHIHPADYFAWPAPKGLKLGRMLPERQDLSQSAGDARVRRFGPGRAGLQSRNRSADGLARSRA